MATQRVSVIDGPLLPGIFERADMEPHLVTAPPVASTIQRHEISSSRSHRRFLYSTEGQRGNGRNVAHGTSMNAQPHQRMPKSGDGLLGIRFTVWFIVIGFSMLCMLPIRQRETSRNPESAQLHEMTRKTWRRARDAGSRPDDDFFRADVIDFSEVERTVQDRSTWIDDTPNLRKR